MGGASVNPKKIKYVICDKSSKGGAGSSSL